MTAKKGPIRKLSSENRHIGREEIVLNESLGQKKRGIWKDFLVLKIGSVTP
jgi:hypothetical protein